MGVAFDDPVEGFSEALSDGAAVGVAAARNELVSSLHASTMEPHEGASGPFRARLSAADEQHA
ncbi:MAG: hypothetical protein U1E22_05735, partial [Coriobacteriia bacterium]|nr:hypothetical protein [Coriobacteriia bacterium]